MIDKDFQVEANSLICGGSRQIHYIPPFLLDLKLRVSTEILRVRVIVKPPTNVKEVCSVIGLLGYLNFFIPAYSEMIRHMTKLMQKKVPFIWDEKCQNSLDLAKENLQTAPIMIYPDKSKPFHLFTDSSNFTWSSVLMQTEDTPEMETPSTPLEKREENSDKQSQKERPPPTFFENKPLKAIVYHSGSFQGLQLNWSAFVKEAATIFKAVL